MATTVKEMQTGDHVIYCADPLLYGVMTISHVTNRGHIICVLETTATEEFHPDELEVLIPDTDD